MPVFFIPKLVIMSSFYTQKIIVLRKVIEDRMQIHSSIIFRC
jgi:hypothetical protein